jgi:hypothetical protein
MLYTTRLLQPLYMKNADRNILSMFSGQHCHDRSNNISIQCHIAARSECSSRTRPQRGYLPDMYKPELTPPSKVRGWPALA